MTLQQFRELNKEAQIEEIKRRGAFLYVRQELGSDVILYQLGSFYIEVHFDSYNPSGLQIKSFEDTGELEVYLQQVNIAELQQLL